MFYYRDRIWRPEPRRSARRMAPQFFWGGYQDVPIGDPWINLDGRLDPGAGAPQYPNFFAPYPNRPPWQVAGVDYAVGPRVTTFKIPGVDADPPGWHWDGVNQFSCTADNAILQGWKIPAGAQIFCDVPNNPIVRDCWLTSNGNFANLIRFWGVSNDVNAGSSYEVSHCLLDGANILIGDQGQLQSTRSGSSIARYNWIKNSGSDGFVCSADADLIEYRYNLIDECGTRDTQTNPQHADIIQLDSGGNYKKILANFNTIKQTIAWTDSGGSQGLTFDANAGSQGIDAQFGICEASYNSAKLTCTPQNDLGYFIRYCPQDTYGSWTFNQNWVDPSAFLAGTDQDNKTFLLASGGGNFNYFGPVSLKGNRDLTTGNLRWNN